MKNITIILKDGGLYEINKEQIEYWTYLFPKVNVYAEIMHLKDLWEKDELPRKTTKSINKYIFKYLKLVNKENASN